MSATLPDFPWDVLAPYGEKARAHPDGLVDLSMGTPVDPVPEVIRAALAEGSAGPGYPTTAGSPALRAAIVDWLSTRHGVTGLDDTAVLPTIGSKELVAWLPTLLGLGSGDVVLIPELAYPTYRVGVALAGARCVPTDSLTSVGPERVRLVWINSPGNPTGRVLPVKHLRKVVDWARQRGAIVASDECYCELGWSEQSVSILHPDVCDGDHTGLLAVHSLSKRSNLAGYRAGLVAGDRTLIRELLAVRKHAGMIMPGPVQVAMTAALGDPAHALEQRHRYERRRGTLYAALTSAGYRVDHSEAGLYLWATRDEDCWATVERLAADGILVTPGIFYGATGNRHVRVALTASDERVEAAAARLTARR
ncbi:MAG: succinyldiaminopimelate transaminase [Actinocatenispora sp.]